MEDQRSDWQRMADLEMAADKAMYEDDDVEDLGEVCEDLGIENVEDLNQEAK
jgi:hypothetical protein